MKQYGWKKPLVIAFALAAGVLTGCADITNQRTLDNPNAQVDPHEGFNRAMFGVNNVIDGAVLRPITWTYRLIPETPRGWVSNFVHNLESPVYFVNSVLEGDVNNSFAVFWRFILNTTVGLGGALDVASSAGLKARDADFGQTLAVWGVGSGPYVYVPILGPGTMRDTFGRIVDIAFNPSVWIDPSTYSYVQAGLTLVDVRSRNFTLIDDVNRTSLDPYATFRSLYLQKRAAEIRKARAAVCTVKLPFGETTPASAPKAKDGKTKVLK